MSPLGKWFQLATRDAELKQMQNEVQQDSNFRARADRMEAPSRDMWGNVPKELQMQFDCGPDKNVRGNIAAMVSFVSTYAKQNGADLGRPDQLVRGPEALSAAVVAAREQFLRSRAELEEALSRLTADVARFALNGLLDAAPVLRNFFASSSSAAAKNSINATGTLSTLGKQEIQELRSALHGVLEETLAEHLAAVDPKLAHDFQDAIVNLAVPIIEPSGGAADASWSARRNSSGQFSHGASSSRMLDTQRIIETIRDFVAENGPTEVESSNDTSCRQSVAVWCLAVATLECLNTLHLYFHAFRKRRQHREQGSASHDGQLQLTNDESSDENVVAQHRSISAKVDAVVAKSGGEGKSKEALALISKTVTDITRKIETELSFPKLRAYQDFLGDMAEREAIQKYPGKEDRQREHRQNLQQLFLKQVRCLTALKMGKQQQAMLVLFRFGGCLRLCWAKTCWDTAAQRFVFARVLYCRLISILPKLRCCTRKQLPSSRTIAGGKFTRQRCRRGRMSIDSPLLLPRKSLHSHRNKTVKRDGRAKRCELKTNSIVLPKPMAGLMTDAESASTWFVRKLECTAS